MHSLSKYTLSDILRCESECVANNYIDKLDENDTNIIDFYNTKITSYINNKPFYNKNTKQRYNDKSFVKVQYKKHRKYHNNKNNHNHNNHNNHNKNNHNNHNNHNGNENIFNSKIKYKSKQDNHDNKPRNNKTTNFKITNLKKIEDNDTVIVNKVRCALNKLSDNNYEDIKMELLCALNDVKDINKDINIDLLFDNKYKTICNCFGEIITLCSSNLYFKDGYYNLLKYVIQKYKSLYDLMSYFITDFDRTTLEKIDKTEYNSAFKNIINIIHFVDNVKYVDPDEDYDEYCVNVKFIERCYIICSLYYKLYTDEIIISDLTVVTSFYDTIHQKLIESMEKENNINTRNTTLYLFNIFIYLIHTDKIEKTDEITTYFKDKLREINESTGKCKPKKMLFVLEDIKL
jgi:hypothetical protein